MKKFLVVLLGIVLAVSSLAGVSTDEVYKIKLKHSNFKNVEVLNSGRNIVIHLSVNAKATEDGKVPAFVLEDSKQIFSYFKKNHKASEYDVIDIMFYKGSYQFANANVWSDTLKNINVQKLNLSNAENKLDVWECKW